MLVFVVALKSARVCADWDVVRQLWQRTYCSLSAQTHSAFRIILVCHEHPGTDMDPNRVDLIEASHLPLPGNRLDRMRDKWTKLQAGLQRAADFAPCHVMPVDADDCVSRRLAAWVAQNPEHRGWYCDRGYIHDEGSRSVFLQRRRFDRLCGTSVILRCERSDLPADPKADPASFPILGRGHSGIVDYMASSRRPLDPLPFPGVVYITGTMENNSTFSLNAWRSRKVALRKLLMTRPLTAGLRAEFGLYPLPDFA